MTNESIKRGLLAATPFIVILILNVFYASFVSAFIYCEWGNAVCQPLRIENVLPSDDALSLLKTDNSLNEKTDANRTLQATRYSGRITWVFLMLSYMLLSLAGLAVASSLIYKTFSDWGKRPFMWMLVALLLSAALGFSLHYFQDLYMPILKSLLLKTVKVDMGEIVEITNRVNSIGFTASFALVPASCAILLPPNKNSSPEGLKELSKRMNYLRLVLYVGTLLLVTGVLLMRSIFHWSLTFVARAGGADGFEKIEGLTSNIVSAEAGFYTLILAGVYLPAAFILQRRARSLQGLPKEPSEKNQKLQDYGMTFSFRESLPRIVAILGPFLVGPIGDLVKNLPK
jgi:hypothetical protein